MPQLILYSFRIVMLAVALSALGIHYLLHPLSQPVVLLLYGIVFVLVALSLVQPHLKKLTDQ
ncbi:MULTISPECIES: hypothetical protein [Altibacter]|uniref:hypothetical protein n=1 Tax=Altibacter TaxID=1535231 RepID=UPI001267B0B5|nr:MULTISPECIES: hypothetical protein [Altibacter]MCW8981448.1 hypothetical protein [Altibacter sp.]MCW9038232.1 hypothetical protein [Altibacter sp.]